MSQIDSGPNEWMPEPDEYGNRLFPDGSAVCPSAARRGQWCAFGPRGHSVKIDGKTEYFPTVEAAARRRAELFGPAVSPKPDAGDAGEWCPRNGERVLMPGGIEATVDDGAPPRGALVMVRGDDGTRYLCERSELRPIAVPAPATPPIDPKMPRRFRWPHADGSGEWHYGCCWPKARPSARWCTDYGLIGYELPSRPDLEWIDPAPEPAER